MSLFESDSYKKNESFFQCSLVLRSLLSRLNSNFRVVPFSSTKPSLSLLSKQTTWRGHSGEWVLDQLWHMMYFIWWNHSPTCAMNSPTLICLDDVCSRDSGPNSHLERQFFFRGQPREYEMWSVTSMTTVRFICQLGVRLVMFFSFGTGFRLRSKTALSL